MERGNVLVIGNSGVGKSTLINSVFGEELAKTGWGTSGTTDELEIYESEKIPFRIIDSIGFEPSLAKQKQAIKAVKKWSQNSAKGGNTDTQINVIWFCVDGTSRKLFPEAIKNFSKATSMWKSVPVIVAITKSYSEPERDENIQMVIKAFKEQKHYAKNLKEVIPVVASPYVLNDTTYVSPEGITELIDATNETMPEGVKAAEQDILTFNLNRKRALAQSIIGVSTTAGVVVGAVPIPFSDALILSPIEIAEINSLAKIYGLGNDEDSKILFKSIVEVGTVGTAAKIILNGLKAIPFINVAASVVNAIVAGVLVAAIGEGTVYVFEQIYLGNKTSKDIEWVKKIIESKFNSDLIEKINLAAKEIGNSTDKKAISKIVLSLIDKK